MSFTENRIILISGPTCTGKTQLSLSLAKKSPKHFVLINADSLAFYSEFCIATARPSLLELQETQCTHYFYGNLSLRNEIHAYNFQTKATEIIFQCHKEGKIPIVTGGSPFYLRALIKGMYSQDQLSCPQHFEHDSIQHLSNEELWKSLKDIDPKSAEKIHANDRYRMERAFRYFLHFQKPISIQREYFESLNPYDFSQKIHPHWNLFHYYCDIQKELHRALIQKRTQAMIKDGLIDEVINVFNSFSSEVRQNIKSFKSIGVREVIEWAYLQNQNPLKIQDLQSLQDLITTHTCQLAKSQRTFFKKISPKTILNMSPENSQQHNEHIIQQILDEISLTLF
jgi:tRNA dimethylallyltransferase